VEEALAHHEKQLVAVFARGRSAPHLPGLAKRPLLKLTFIERQNLMKPSLLIILAALIAGCATDRRSGVGSSDSGSEKLGGTDIGSVAPKEADFARKACQSDVTEAEIGKLAASNTRSEAVRNLAKQVVAERTKAEKELSEIFARKGLRPESKLSRNFQNALDRLAVLRGRAFDQSFKQEMIDQNQAAIQIFEDQAAHGSDPDLKTFAQNHLPQLRAQLAAAEQLNLSASEAESPPPSDAGALNSILRAPGAVPGGNVPR